jgi:PhnB protein
MAVHLVVDDADAAADWYGQALNAQEVGRLRLPDGSTLTVDLLIGDTTVAIAGAMPATAMQTPGTLGGTPAAFHLSVDDATAAWQRAVDAGATVFEPLHDAFWGERTGQFLDPSGHRWAVAQRIEEVSREEVARRAAELFLG